MSVLVALDAWRNCFTTPAKHFHSFSSVALVKRTVVTQTVTQQEGSCHDWNVKNLDLHFRNPQRRRMRLRDPLSVQCGVWL